MASATLYKFSKRKNSTKQPTGTGTVVTLTLKSGTSFISPTFLLNNSGKPDYNYVSFEGSYYFIRDIVSVRNDLWELFCEIDALATAKASILASTQYVCYSSTSGNTWLADSRIPVLKSTTVSRSSSSTSFLSSSGCYILSVVGKYGVCSYRLPGIAALITLISNLQTWSDSLRNAASSLIDGSQDDVTAIATVGQALVESGFVGNSYEIAVQCIRSCVWVPYDGSWIGGSQSTISLGNYDSNISAYYVPNENKTDSASVSIPWHYSDWRRGYCEDVYLYLPLVGMVQLSSDSLTHASSITVKVSIARVAGDIAYEVVSGNEVIGTFGASPAASVPVGINQAASLGSIVQSAFAGAEKTVSMAVNSSISPISAGASTIGAGVAAVHATYDLANTALSTNLTTIGGIGGSAGAGLDNSIICYTVAHDTIITPSDMQATMGLPTMKPMSLSSLTGYCQCANAHVELDTPSSIMDIVDSFINSGFYIE